MFSRLHLLLFLFTIGGLSAYGQGNKKLNVLFILADDLGYMDVGFNNPATFYETPNLDALAKSGMVFTDFYAACQVCSPTRASILTGKYPARENTTNYFSGKRSGKFEPAVLVDEMSTDEVTLAETLKEGGYRTFLPENGIWAAKEAGQLIMGSTSIRAADQTDCHAVIFHRIRM